MAILSANRPHWLLAKMAAVFADGMACGIYLTSSAESVSYILQDSVADILVVEDAAHMATALKATKDNPGVLKAVVQIEGEIEESLPGVPCMTWSALMDLGRAQSESGLNDRLSRMAINQCCLLVYTSGTTGNPKGMFGNV